MIFPGLFARDAATARPPKWNGYMQTRFADDYRDLTGFSIRRAKLWVKGKAPLPGNWFYKVQGLFRYQTGGAYSLQDVYAEYRRHEWSIRLGQQVPDFSLQRSQPDYAIPVIERGRVIDALIPAAETGARDIGARALVNLPENRGHVSLGIFNGNGGNQSGNEDRDFLFTHRLVYRLNTGQFSAAFGYSLAYRRTVGLKFKKILGNHPFTGDDFRWGLEARFRGKQWQLQGEYLETHLENRRAWGYYLLADLLLPGKNRAVFSLDKYRDLNPATDDHPWFIIGLNHRFAGDRAKLMLDQRVQFADRQTHYLTSLQLQLFFN